LDSTNYFLVAAVQDTLD